MGARTDTKQKMLVAAVSLLRERGAAGVTIDSVLARSGAPRGSVYHHFPGGRPELMTASLTAAGAVITAFIEHSADSGAATMLTRFGAFWRKSLHDTDFAAGCPVASVAIGGSSEDEHLRTLVAEIFGRWNAALTAALIREGLEPERAQRLATVAVAAIEGALMMCRIQRSTKTLDDTIVELSALFAANP